ncbi:unnamed protein product [Enterobius vermicularis]|uniref:Phospholipase A2 n=1 Tax=Enterobius vermicularis TaxID=51028 RepID=A0A0N4VQI0_ENTVE|nr:unnamed protein product [Enterobius vermicularis]
MQAVVIAVAATLVAKSSAFGQSRALWNLGSMGSCNLGYYPLVYYNGYGCWCGMGGSGTPVDEIDECCKMHDLCYDRAIGEGKCKDVAAAYFTPYDWQCVNSTVVCTSTSHPCKAAMCNCDKTVVECWKKYPQPTKLARCSSTSN